MIILKQINLNNFLSHKSTNIPLEEGDKLLIDGASGSGKSSIIDALLWALYGRGRADTRSLIRRGAKECSVFVILYDTEKKIFYGIDRTATPSGKHTVVVTSGGDNAFLNEIGTGGIRDTDAYIAREILGASYQLFINSVVSPQDNTESFVSASSVRRKELLLEILKTQDVDEYLEKTKELLYDKEAIILASKATSEASSHLIEEYKEKINDLPRTLVKIGVAEDEVTSSKKELVVAEKKEGVLRGSFESSNKNRIALGTLKARVVVNGVKDVEGTLAECNEKIKEEEGVRAALREAISHNNFLSSLISDRPKMRDYSSEIDSIDRRIRKLVDETLPCPAGDDCPYTKMVGPELADLKRERAKKEEDMAQQELGVKAWEASVEGAGPRIDTRELEEKLKETDLAHSRLSLAQAALEQRGIREEISRLEKELESAPTREEIGAAVEQVSLLSRKLFSAEMALSELRGQEAYLLKLGSEIKRLTEEVEGTEKHLAKLDEEVKILADLKDALGANGVTAVALDYLLPSLEDKINEILSMLSDFRVVLSTQKDGVGGKIEGLFISIVNAQGESMDLNSYSGGERVRVAVAISEALASLQRCGFRILDETISALDENMLDSFTSVLTKVQSRYSQLICVSHLPQVKDLFEKRLTVRKLDGVSLVS